jgi:hypothetical protein
MKQRLPARLAVRQEQVGCLTRAREVDDSKIITKTCGKPASTAASDVIKSSAAAATSCAVKSCT